MKQAVYMVITALFFSLFLLRGAGAATEQPGNAPTGVTLYYFWGEGCPHCQQAKPFLNDLQKRYPALQIKSWEVLQHRENVPILMEMAKARNKEATGVPTFIIGKEMVSGFGKGTGGEIERLVRSEFEQMAANRPAAQQPAAGNSAADKPAARQPEQKVAPADTAFVTIPGIGRVESSSVSLPVFTVIIAGLDSFNPCAFFVLFFLLSLLIHAHSRRRMLLIGATFVFFSGLVYFVFMAAWLNLFLLTGTLPMVTVAAGIIALIVAVINIKDFFFFEQGISLVIPEEQKPKLFGRMRKLLAAGSTLSILTGTAVLALAANSYELLCTAGFPMVYTRVLTLQQLPISMYYLYLAFYNIVYIIPLAVIVGIFTVTLGSRKLTEWQGRVLKLVSGLMMLGLGLMLLINPSLLNSPLASAGILGATLAVSTVIILLSRKALHR